MERGLGGEYWATASSPCTVVWTSPTLGARWINRATGFVLRKRIDVYLFVDNETRLRGSRLGNQACTPERCPLDLCRSVGAPTVTGASINEDARSLIENAPSLNQDAPSPRPDPRSLRPDPRSFRPYRRSLPADARSLRENARA